VLLGGVAAAPAAAAQPSGSELARLIGYAQARAAETLGASERAARGYGAALALDPDNEMLAARALSQGIAAGDLPLAIKAAHVIERSGTLTPDARFLLLVEAARGGDWGRVEAQVNGIAEDDVFAFMVPVLRAWTDQGSGRGDPLARLKAGASDTLAGSYIVQHRPLLLMSLGRKAEAIAALKDLDTSGPSREWRIRMSLAATIARQGNRDEALQLLQGDAEPLAAARRLVSAGKRLPGEVQTAEQGLAEFMLELSYDLRRQEVLPLSLSFARYATFLAPDYGEARLAVGELLGAQGLPSSVDVLRTIPGDDPFAAAAQDASIRLLAETGEQASALKEAEAAVKGKSADVSDWTRLGDLYGEAGRHDESAAAYAKALKVAKSGGSRRPEWALLLLHGGALEQANRWTEAKASLEAAYRLAPREPLVLNYLGYSQLERRENIGAAERLIGEARNLAPESPQITDSLGWARYLQGDVPKAIELLEEAVQNEPADPAIYEHLGDAYYSAGRRFEARYAWSAALVSANDTDAPRLRAKIEAGLRSDLASP
jgi:tetratricopeptide (TPR) repeat protein